MKPNRIQVTDDVAVLYTEDRLAIEAVDQSRFFWARMDFFEAVKLRDALNIAIYDEMTVPDE